MNGSLSALVLLLPFQAYLVLYRPKQGGRQGTAWRSSTLQNVVKTRRCLKRHPAHGYGVRLQNLYAVCRLLFQLHPFVFMHGLFSMWALFFSIHQTPLRLVAIDSEEAKHFQSHQHSIGVTSGFVQNALVAATSIQVFADTPASAISTPKPPFHVHAVMQSDMLSFVERRQHLEKALYVAWLKFHKKHCRFRHCLGVEAQLIEDITLSIPSRSSTTFPECLEGMLLMLSKVAKAGDEEDLSKVSDRLAVVRKEMFFLQS